MDRIQPELLTTTEPYIQRNVTIDEFIDHIEQRCGGEAARRLRWLLQDYLSDPMPAEDWTPIPSPGDGEDGE